MTNGEPPPKLFGGMSYGAGTWQLKVDANELAITPAPIPYAAICFCVGFGLVAGVFIWWFNTRFFPGQPGYAIGCLGAIFAVVFTWGFAAAMYVVWSGQQGRPNWLTFSAADGVVRLGRAGRAWPTSRLDHWELVSGTWTKGGMDGPSICVDLICELHLVAREPDRGQSVFPVVGHLGRHGLDKLAKTVSERTGLPLVVVEERGSWFHPPRGEVVTRTAFPSKQ